MIRSLGGQSVDDEAAFLTQRQGFTAQAEAARAKHAELQNELTEHGVTLRQGKHEHDAQAAEIGSLKARLTNIPSEQVAIRASACASLGISVEAMPFAGELLQIRDTERAWEGAVERLLHNFGLSLLVPDEYYAAVAEWVDQTQLRGRLVYFRVREGMRSELRSPHRDSVVRKLAIKTDSQFYDWLERELAARFDVACCATQEQFRRETRAVTRAGQIKGAERHEKDDRHRLDDRGRYVLGWSNAAKIEVLEIKAKAIITRLQSLGDIVVKIQDSQRNVANQLTALSKLDEYTEFRDLDWQSVATELEQLKREKQTLESSSDILALLAVQLNAATQAVETAEEKLRDANDKRSKTDQKLSDAESLRQGINKILEASGATSAAHFEILAEYRQEAFGDHHLSVESSDNSEHRLREWLQVKLDAEEKRLKRLHERIVQAMSEYRQAFRLETAEVDAGIEAAFEYRKMLDALQRDDLPRFESQFKELLNENTIREVANFQSQLNRERETIRERIAHINESLTQIDYNDGRYILLQAEPTMDTEIRDFQADLRACTEGTLSGSADNQYSEAKFLQVKQIIERFTGRDGQSEQDRRWTNKVTDVRNWFVFAASERWREDHREHEHYSDSVGKSGGQKEKLAYTILAASLAYQFGLEWGGAQSRSFRFVVIDEAFGRGSDESAQYGLRLFKKLDLQLLIVTPLQKIHIIEPFVASVGFVQNDEGRNSQLRNLSIEEYHAEKARLAG